MPHQQVTPGDVLEALDRSSSDSSRASPLGTEWTIHDFLEALPAESLADDIVKANLEELLLILIGTHERTYGEALLTDLEELFDVSLSPGTLYPTLYELTDEQLLSVHPRVRTKEYALADGTAVTDRLEASMRHHYAYAMLLASYLQSR